MTTKAKNKQSTAEKKAAKEEKKVLLAKSYKLGEKATLFYDPVTGKKIVGKNVVEFSITERSSDKFRTALAGRHIVEATDDDIEGEDEVSEDLKAFKALTTKEDKIKFVLENYELEDDEKDAIEKGLLGDAELLALVEEYEAA